MEIGKAVTVSVCLPSSAAVPDRGSVSTYTRTRYVTQPAETRIRLRRPAKRKRLSKRYPPFEFGLGIGKTTSRPWCCGGRKTEKSARGSGAKKKGGKERR